MPLQADNWVPAKPARSVTRTKGLARCARRLIFMVHPFELRGTTHGAVKYHLSHLTMAPQIHYITQVFRRIGGWARVRPGGSHKDGPERSGLGGTYRGVDQDRYADVKLNIARFEGVSAGQSEGRHAALAVFQIVEQVDWIVLGQRNHGAQTGIVGGGAQEEGIGTGL